MLTSIIVTTYNRPDALKCVLQALNDLNQSEVEIVIADDGSGDLTKKIVEEYAANSNNKVKHVWQEDNGFRAAQIRNKAVACSAGEYLIFLDGDCVVFPDFVDKHLALSEVGYFVRGSRVMISETYTKEFIQNDINISEMSFFEFLSLRLVKKINRIVPLLAMPLGILRKMKKMDWYGVKTCNLGMWRNDFLAINGFDERYVGWGHEDADLAVRLIRNNVCRKEGVNAVTVLHLWHSMNDRSQLPENVARLKMIQESKDIRAAQGVSQY